MGINGEERPFRHPFLQTWALSVGEFTCILIFLAWNAFKRNHSKSYEVNDDDKVEESNSQQGFSPLLFLPPAILHLTSRCLGYLSLTLTTASSYQMLAGSNLVFTCIFSSYCCFVPICWHFVHFSHFGPASAPRT